MTFMARYTERHQILNIWLDEGDFDPVATFSREILTEGDARFLTFDENAGIIMLYCDDGAARYEIVQESNRHPYEVKARLVSVERPCDICKLRGTDRHHWWCTRAA